MRLLGALAFGDGTVLDNVAQRLITSELASRLSFFLWSSIPDERLLDLAARKQLTTPATLEQEVRRMMTDPRAATALVDGFAAQCTPDGRLPDATQGADHIRNVSRCLWEP